MLWSVLFHAGALTGYLLLTASPPVSVTTRSATPERPSVSDAALPPGTTNDESHRAQELLRPLLEEVTRELPESQRKTLQDQVAKDLAPAAMALAEASSQSTADLTDLSRQVEQLHRDLILKVQERLQERLEADTADRFLTKLDQETAPALARTLQQALDIHVVRALDQQVGQAVATQRMEALQARQAAVGKVRDAWHLLHEVNDHLRHHRQGPEALATLLTTAIGHLDVALAKAQDLDQDQRDSLGVAKTTVADAQRAITPEAVAKARAAVDAAIAALIRTDHQEERARQALHAALRQDLRERVERQLLAEFRSTALPALKPSLVAQAQAAGITDPTRLEQLTTAAVNHLAIRVPALVGIGQSIQPRLTATTTPSESHSIPSDSPLGQLLDRQRQDLAVTIDRQVKTAVQGQPLDAPVQRLGAAIAQGTDAAAAQAYDRLGRLAAGVRQGRSGLVGPLDVDPLRHLGVDSTRLVVQGTVMDDAASYRERADRLAQRPHTGGEAWTIAQNTGTTLAGDASTRLVSATSLWSPPGSAQSVGTSPPFQPTFPTLAFTTATFLPADFPIDGSPGKWSHVPEIPLHPEWGQDPAQQSMQLGWRSDGLYLRFRIRDPDRRITKAKPQNFWDSDNVEVWFDGLNTKADYRSRTTGQHFWVWPSGAMDQPDLAGGEARIERKGGPVEIFPLTSGSLPRATTLDDGGWTVEFHLPRPLLVDANLAAGRIIGWNAYINTMGGTNWYWSAGKKAKTWYQPNTWGDVLLAGSDATLELIRPDQPLIPGRPFRICVRDSDQDQHPDQRDQVTVNLTPALGRPVIVSLRETGPATGVFEANIATALAVDDTKRDALALHAGEPLSITYLDRVRASGARDQVLRLRVVAASPLATMIRNP